MSTTLNDTEIAARLSQLKDWHREGLQIRKQYTFEDFTSAMRFVNRIADLAEKLDHHPDILIRYQYVTLTLSTHSAGGLTELDFMLAQMIDA
jgi:4a-hydroxytetrahydrobiopterin dehydratase